MLEAIVATGMPAPRVLGVAGPVLFLDALKEARAGTDHWPAFGENLARMHTTPGDRYGWPEDYAFGPVAIPNAIEGLRRAEAHCRGNGLTGLADKAASLKATLEASSP